MVSNVPSQQEGSWFKPWKGLSVCGLHVLPVPVWVSFEYSGFLPQSKDMHVRLIGGSKFPIGMIVGVYGCLSTCGTAMDWCSVQCVHLPFAQGEL